MEATGHGNLTGRTTAGVTRREFLRFAGGVVVASGLGLPVGGRARPAEAGVRAAPAPEMGDLNAWLRVGADGRVAVFAPTPEVGQGLRTSLAQLAADEIGVPVSAVDVVLGDTDRVPPDPGVCAGEALSVIGPRVRRAAADAREILREIAAGRWGVPAAEVALRDGRAVLLPDPDRSVPIGDLARGERLPEPPPESPRLKPTDEHQVIGRSVPRLEGPAYVRGRARYGADVRLPNMAYGRVLRPPCLGARLVRVETRMAAAQPGVIAVVQDGDFVGVVATRPDIAERALRAVQADWREPGHATMGWLYQDLRSSAKLDETVAARGDSEAALAAARHGYSASYRLPYAAHASMEPRAAAADPGNDRLTIHASAERPFVHRDAVAQAMGMSAGRVRVIATAVGGAFGGKESSEVSVHAARLARVVNRPVLVSQTREEEMSWNPFRPAALVDVRCGVTGDGEVCAWECDVFNAGGRGADPPYRFPHLRVRSYRCASPLPQGASWAQGAPASTFAREVHLSHIASQFGVDPVAFRLRHLAPDDRLARVARTAAERSSWGDRRQPTGLGVGFACAEDAGSFAAVVADLQVVPQAGQVRVRRIWAVQEGGLVINPDNARNQIEGAVAMGLGLALKEVVRYEQGRILTRTFRSYPIPTFRDLPDIEITLLPDPERPPQGEGTAVFCAIAPAVANAVFDATGKWLRELPLTPAILRATS